MRSDTISPKLRSVRSMQQQDSMKYWWVVLVAVLCMVPLLFLGYGSDNDTYGVLQSGYSTWHLHVLSTSRDPGYGPMRRSLIFSRRSEGLSSVI